MKVKLQDVVDMIDMGGEEISAYLNKRTGELYPLNHEELEAAEMEEEDAEEEGESLDQPEWLKESIQKAREVIGSEDWIELPTKEDIHEWAIMEAFCRSIPNREVSERLLNTIRGSGAFGRFRGALEALDLRHAWFGFRAAEVEKIAGAWLEENEIGYTREAG